MIVRCSKFTIKINSLTFEVLKPHLRISILTLSKLTCSLFPYITPIFFILYCFLPQFLIVLYISLSRIKVTILGNCNKDKTG